MVSTAGMRKPGRRRAAALDAKLDAALLGTFPASDPVAVGGTTSTEPPSRPVDRKAPLLDLAEVAALRRRPIAG